MSSASYPIVTGSKKGIQLDPRTKLLLLLTITTLMFSTSNEGIMNLVKPLLSLVPFILILSERRFQTAAKYLILYAACFALERVALIWASGLPSFVLLAVTSIMTRFAPGIMMGAYLIASTSVSEFIGAMERMHLTEKIVIPLSVIFRFFPTVSEEYQAIRDANLERQAIPFERSAEHLLYGHAGGKPSALYRNSPGRSVDQHGGAGYKTGRGNPDPAGSPPVQRQAPYVAFRRAETEGGHRICHCIKAVYSLL